ncbi:cytochrome c biogenesis protein ResB [Alkalihalobacillus oceani]|uniref:cytochrome c biogenesis protein ResB n=1 Tax=Halalkalibacter oceani TaxID=1653776 RepID=UPI002041C3B2|nr:cytochrome c biogenesis protein ResB [Halalkalibacter oceani]
MNSPNQEENEVSFLAIGENFDPSSSNHYRLTLSGAETKHVTGLTVRKDYTLPFLIVGGAIFMIGLVQGSYWTHRRIWLKQEGDRTVLAAHTNKSWYGFKQEIFELTEKLGISEPIDRRDDVGSSKGEGSKNG